MPQNCLYFQTCESETNFDTNDRSSLQYDPFHDLGDDDREKFHKLDCVVFAEPLKIESNVSYEEHKSENTVQEEAAQTIDNVTIIKRNGKRKKYKMNIDALNPICPQHSCKKSFTSITLLKAHIRKTHCAAKDYVCEKCGASFTARYLLNRHYAVHEDDKVPCPVCKKRLSKRTSLPQHLRSHTGTRVHECQYCKKRFFRKSTLKVHVNFLHKGNDG